MRVVVNALPVTNLSGSHVVTDLLRRLIAAGEAGVEWIILCHADNERVFEPFAGAVTRVRCPAFTARWIGRMVWECFRLPRRLVQWKADLLLMTSGAVLPVAPVPQVALAMNPWCFAREVHTTAGARAKAWLQRRAYRRCVRDAAAVWYLSGALRDAYEREAGRSARRSEVVYTGLGGDVAAAVAAAGVREANRILCVSVMAPHKGIETLIEAVAELRGRHGRVARLVLAGGWPDRGYEAAMLDRVKRLGLEAQVERRGHVPREVLLREYAGATVFALLSRCESFGIPGAEAQAFGTPVLCSDAGAMAEVYGAGAQVVPVGDARAAADALEAMLGDPARWTVLSEAARANARRFGGGDGARLVGALKAAAEGRRA